MSKSGLLTSCADSCRQTFDHNRADSLVVFGLGSPATCMREGIVVCEVVARRLAWTRFHAGLFDDVGLLRFLWIVRDMVAK